MRLGVEPVAGLEPATDGLQNRCSTTELNWHPSMTYSMFLISRLTFADVLPKICAMKRKQLLEPIEVNIGAVIVKIYRRERMTASGKARMVFEVVDKKPNGARRFTSFSDEAKARHEAERIARQVSVGNAKAAAMTNTEAEIYGRAIVFLRPTGIPLEVAAAKYAEAFKILGGDNILEAARFYTRHQVGHVARRKVAEVIAELIAARKARGKSARYLDDLRFRLGRFAKTFGVDISTVTTAEVQRWLNGLKGKSQTIKCYRTVLGTLFNFAESCGYIVKGSNPVEDTQSIDATNGEVEIYSPAEIAALLKAAPIDFIPYLALGAFAGVRSAEIERLDWSAIDLAGGFIHVASEKSKTRSRRLVPIQPNLSAWLAPYAGQAGLIWKRGPNILRDVRAETVKAAKTEWKDNALRHSYISYRLADTQNAAQVALEAGNSPAVVFKHYRELVKPDAAKSWFAIAPEDPANVIPMTNSQSS